MVKSSSVWSVPLCWYCANTMLRWGQLSGYVPCRLMQLHYVYHSRLSIQAIHDYCLECLCGFHVCVVLCGQHIITVWESVMKPPLRERWIVLMRRILYSKYHILNSFNDSGVTNKVQPLPLPEVCRKQNVWFHDEIMAFYFNLKGWESVHDQQ